MNVLKFILVFGCLFGAIACDGSKPDSKLSTTTQASATPKGVVSTKVEVKLPKRIILMIGDGMGLPVVTAAAYANGGLEMLKMPVVSYMRTHEAEYLTTDSAASATALSTGHKTHFEGISVKAGTTRASEGDHATHLHTMVQAARSAGWKTGLVATSRIVHATPAAFASHRANRKSYEEIALDMSTSGVDVLMGAGRKFFSARKDGKDLLAQMKTQGYTVALTPESLTQAVAQPQTTKLVGLMYDKDMPALKRGPRSVSLASMVDTSLEVLDRGEDKGFFLMVEGSQIDWEAHALDGRAAIEETLDFDRAVGRALRYAAGRDDTLVVVTADHETGGFAVLDAHASRRALGALSTEGIAGANALVATTFKGDTQAQPDALQQVPVPKGSVFAPGEASSPEFMTSFGFMSMASRKRWTKSNRYASSHTNAMVPLFAQGTGSALIRDVQDNADLGVALQSMIASSSKTTPQVRDTFPVARPKNVILMVGDGMGLAPVSASFYVQGRSHMLTAPYKGLVATHATNYVVNDSAATATALATGRRTRYGTVGMAPSAPGAPLSAAQSVLEAAELKGLKTGLVTTTTITHATPAAFYAHQPKRKDERAIAQDFLSMPTRLLGADGVDVAMGGGGAMFSAKDLAVLATQGVTVESQWTDAPLKGRTLGLYAQKGLEQARVRLANPQAPTLPKMTSRALDSLGTHDKGFFLLIEGGQIDWAQHALDKGDVLLPELREFDDAVGVAMAYAKKHGDTLVIVTADHDHTLSLLDEHYAFHAGWCGEAKRCGGPVEFKPIRLSADPSAHREGFSNLALRNADSPPSMMIQYAWLPQRAHIDHNIAGPHSAHFVPLMSYGPMADQLSGFFQQPQLGTLLLQWVAALP